jgi:hypothetical protein
MKSLITLLFILIFNSIAFASMADQIKPSNASPQQPEEKPALSLADGFLSFFEFFVFKPQAPVDSLKVNLPSRKNDKEGAAKKN